LVGAESTTTHTHAYKQTKDYDFKQRKSTVKTETSIGAKIFSKENFYSNRKTDRRLFIIYDMVIFRSMASIPIQQKRSRSSMETGNYASSATI